MLGWLKTQTPRLLVASLVASSGGPGLLVIRLDAVGTETTETGAAG